MCVRLGVWQWHKGVLRSAEEARFARGAERTLLPGATSPDALPLFQRVSVSGELDGAHQFLLDNRSYQGRPGYEVLTPLTRADQPALLIDRGWVPFTGSRAQLPDVSLRARAPSRSPGASPSCRARGSRAAAPPPSRKRAGPRSPASRTWRSSPPRSARR